LKFEGDMCPRGRSPATPFLGCIVLDGWALNVDVMMGWARFLASIGCLDDGALAFGGVGVS
jgi:hypothetical protein